MSTTMRDLGLATRGEPMSRGRSRPGGWWKRDLDALEHWAVANPANAALGLTVVYLAGLGALVAVLAASAVNTLVGAAVLILFAAMVLVYVAVAIYVVMPER